jgi:hypothetical protein
VVAVTTSAVAMAAVLGTATAMATAMAAITVGGGDDGGCGIKIFFSLR